MAYFLLAAGVLLIIYGAVGLKSGAAREKKSVDSNHSFDDVLNESIILKKLDSIEDKIDNLGNGTAVLQGSNEEEIPAEEDNMNSRISHMADQGYTVEEICKRFGMLKGDPPLRLGMKE